MMSEAWFWSNWKHLSKTDGVTDKHGLVLIALAQKAGFSSTVSLEEPDFAEIANVMGTTPRSIKDIVNKLVERKVLIKKGRTVTFPVSEEVVNVVSPTTKEEIPTEVVKEVFDFWVETMKAAYKTGQFQSKRSNFSGTMQLTNARIKSIKKALKVYSSEDLKKAIVGASKSEYHMTEGHTDLPVILRYDSTNKRNNIETFMSQTDKKGKWTVETEGESGEFDL